MLAVPGLQRDQTGWVALLGSPVCGYCIPCLQQPGFLSLCYQGDSSVFAFPGPSNFGKEAKSLRAKLVLPLPLGLGGVPCLIRIQPDARKCGIGLGLASSPPEWQGI